ncbi:MAG TPA: TOMM precursor leader peptide-binding protein [Ktedonobacteraceae bacterium]|nr:TOMM precursor leader peptide-binding protein [Ktedonobacteraceae bacterium]
MIDIAEIRPKLKQSSVFLQTDDGVFFQSSDTAFRLRGKSIARWISALSPYMTGQYTLDELCDRLEPAYRDAVVRLVDVLLERGVLKNAVLETPELLEQAVRQRFRTQIEFLDHYVDRPLERFKDFRESRVLLIGAGESLTSLALCLARNGMQQLLLAPMDDPALHLARLEPELTVLRRCGCEAQLALIANSSPAVVDLARYDVIVYCADNGSLKDVLALNQQCADAGRPFLPAIVFAGQAILGPLFKAPQGPCWLCAQMRLSANASEDCRAALWQALTLGNDASSQETTFFVTNAQRIGHGLGFELFKILTGALPSETENSVIIQNLETLESVRGRLAQHPLCPVCSHADSTLARQRLEEAITGKHDCDLARTECASKFNELVDAATGVFKRFADDDLLQLPLKSSRLVGGSPATPLRGDIDVRVFDVESTLDARSAVMFEGIKQYALALPDARQMLFASANDMLERGKEIVAAQELCGASGITSLSPETPMEWLPAYSPVERSYRSVPAAAVYPCSALNQSGVFERNGAGVTAGLTFRDAFNSGMFTALGHQHLRKLMCGHGAVVVLDPRVMESSDSDVDLAYLLKSATRFEHPFTLLEVVSESPLHLVIAHTSDSAAAQIVTVGVGLSGPAAAKKALLDFVGGLQLLQNEGRTPTPGGDLFPGFSPRADFPRANPQASRFWVPEATPQDVEDYLGAHGYDALFVNITPSDIWETRAIISGKVLLARRED